jgi:hypothetical protein
MLITTHIIILHIINMNGKIIQKIDMMIMLEIKV